MLACAAAFGRRRGVASHWLAHCWRCRVAVHPARALAVAPRRHRRREWDAFARGADVVGRSGAAAGDVAPFQRISRGGRYDPPSSSCSTTTRPGPAGLRGADAACAADGRQRLLVDRGWVPFTGSRAQPAGHRRSHGAGTVTVDRARGQSAERGARLGHAAPAAGSWPKVTSFPTLAELAGALGTRWSRGSLLLDPRSAGRLCPEWQPPGLSPLRIGPTPSSGGDLPSLVLSSGGSWRSARQRGGANHEQRLDPELRSPQFPHRLPAGRPVSAAAARWPSGCTTAALASARARPTTASSSTRAPVAPVTLRMLPAPAAHRAALFARVDAGVRRRRRLRCRLRDDPVLHAPDAPVARTTT